VVAFLLRDAEDLEFFEVACPAHGLRAEALEVTALLERVPWRMPGGGQSLHGHSFVYEIALAQSMGP
jgi:hypothetical protein